MRLLLTVLLYALSAAAATAAGMPAAVPAVAAASDLQFALPAIVAAFTRQTDRSVRLVFGSSGNFGRQIAQGAPFELFLSADEDVVRALAKAGRTEGDGALYAVGRIVLFAPSGSPFTPDAEMRGLASALAGERIAKFAIANPEHAPYGRAAREALTRARLWGSIEPKLVLGENVSQAAQFATSGSAQGGIFAYSLALSPAIGKLGSYVLIPAEMHAPLRQRMALLRGAGDTARAFYRFVQEPAARAILRQHGFAPPAE